ncbi:ATP-binding protein [Roseateles sp. L2-2]|uniref:hybrid sensor histidine kinase/response regulator n=1 Tax=Roseateles sp. L2-2 TaxID=3422597 RepID=UPI003D36325D
MAPSDPSHADAAPASMPAPPTALPPFLRGGGDIARLIAAFDWGATSLGPLAHWPDHVRHATALMLRARTPIVMLWGEPGVMIYNDAYGVFAGARHPQLLGSNVREGWPEVADFNDHVMRVGLAGGTLNYEDQELVLHRHGRAETVWMNLDYSPLLDDDGEPAGVMAIVVETTGKVAAERRVRSERERLTQLFEQAPSFMAVLAGPEHRFESVNPAYQRLIGHRDVIGRSVAEALPDAAAQGYVTLLDTVYESGRAYTAHAAQFVAQGSDGPDGQTEEHFLDFVYQPIRDESGAVTHIFVEGVDVTARVRGEQRGAALAGLSERLREVGSPADIGFASAQMLGMMLTATRAGYCTVDHETETVRIDRDWRRGGLDSLAGQRRFRDYGSFVDQLKRDEVVEIADVREDPRTSAHLDRFDAMRVRSIVNVPVLEQGRLVALLFVHDESPRAWSADDVSLIRETAHRTRVAVERARHQALAQEREERLLRSDRRKDEFLATLAHELRNPLAPIRNAVHLLAAADREDRFTGIRELLERQVTHMVRLVDDLLEVSRISRGLITLRHEPVNLSGVVDAAVESSRPLIDREGHRLTLRFDGPAPWVQGDPVRLTQLLVNLLNNAARYTDAGGRIDVHIARDAGDAVLTVTDNGIGISAEQLPQLFELFSQLDRSHSRSQGGLGIGLSLSQTLARLHGGQLTATSDGPGRGSSFQLRLPEIAAAVAGVPAPVQEDAPLNARLLLVDDNRDAADTTAELLRLMGAEVAVAYDGPSALGAVRQLRPDAILLDIGMPDMDGHEVARRLRAMADDIGRPRLIALTGWGQEQDREKTREAGFDDHMVKPVDVDELKAALMAGRPSSRTTTKTTTNRTE